MDELLKLLTSSEVLMSIIAGVLTLVVVLLLVLITRGHRRSRAQEASASVSEEAAVPEVSLESALRDEIASSVRGMGETVTRAMADIVRAQQVQNDAFQLRIGEIQQSVKGDGEQGRALDEIALKMDALVRENTARMDEVVKTVDEKLGQTLEERFDARFQKVTEQMDHLYQGIEDVRALSGDVYDLKRVLSGAKIGGMIGETQLSMLLSQILSPDQYEENKRFSEDGERAAFAVKLPGRGRREPISYLAIDARFSKEATAQLLYAIDGGNEDEIERAWGAFEEELMTYAEYVAREFVNPPLTAEFAVIFFPSDGLYAQALRRPMIVSRVQDECRVLLTGPTTLSALLNSLQMGFKTLKIERRSEEVWATLGAVRGEFVNFADALSKTQKRIYQATEAIEDAARKARLIERKLKGIESGDEDKHKELYGKTENEDDFLREIREDWD